MSVIHTPESSHAQIEALQQKLEDTQHDLHAAQREVMNLEEQVKSLKRGFERVLSEARGALE